MSLRARLWRDQGQGAARSARELLAPVYTAGLLRASTPPDLKEGESVAGAARDMSEVRKWLAAIERREWIVPMPQADAPGSCNLNRAVVVRKARARCQHFCARSVRKAQPAGMKANKVVPTGFFATIAVGAASTSHPKDHPNHAAWTPEKFSQRCAEREGR